MNAELCHEVDGRCEGRPELSLAKSGISREAAFIGGLFHFSLRKGEKRSSSRGRRRKTAMGLDRTAGCRLVA